MNVGAISNIIKDLPDISNVQKSKEGNFGEVLSNFIGQVNQNQLDANNKTQEYVEGGNIQIQDVMIAGEKAQTSLQLLMEIRNKAVDMYKTLTNIPV